MELKELEGDKFELELKNTQLESDKATLMKVAQRLREHSSKVKCC